MDSIDPLRKSVKQEATLLLILGLSIAACLGGALAPPEEAGSEEKSPPIYRVKGTRDGPSFFPELRYPEVQPLRDGELDFQHYPTYGEIYSFLQEWAQEYPQILELYSVGKSFEGRDIWQVTVTNKQTEPDTDKPGMFAEGGRHSGEVTSSVSIFWLIHHLVSN